MSEWGPCVLGDRWCLHVDSVGEWVQVKRTPAGDPIHADCENTTVGALLMLSQALNQLGTAVWDAIKRVMGVYRR